MQEESKQELIDTTTQAETEVEEEEEEVQEAPVAVPVTKVADDDSDVDETAAEADISKMHTFNGKFLASLRYSLENVVNSDPASLLELSQKAFSHIYRLSGSVTQSHGASLQISTDFVEGMRQKAFQIADNVASFNNSDATPEVIAEETKKVTVQILQDLVANLLEEFDGKAKKFYVTRHSALMLIRLILALMKNPKGAQLKSTTKLQVVLIKLANELHSNTKLFDSTCLAIWNAVLTHSDFDHATLLKWLKSERAPHYSSYAFLAHMYAHMEKDAEILEHLNSSWEKVVFNDQKDPAVTLYSVAAFGPYFARIDEATFDEHIFNKLEFCMKRDEAFLPNITALVGHIKAFKFTDKQASQLIMNLLTEELLLAERADVSNHVKVVLANVADADAVLKSVLDEYMVGIFKTVKAKLSVRPEAKLFFFQTLFSAMTVLKSNLTAASQPNVQNILKSLMEFLIQSGLKNEFEFDRDTILFIQGQGEIECLSALLQAHVGKITTASQANFLSKMRKFIAADVEKVLIDHLFKVLAATNIAAYTNMPIVLAFMNCLCSLDQISKIQGIDALQRYSTAPDSMINTEAFFNTSPSLSSIENQVNVFKTQLMSMFDAEKDFSPNETTVLSSVLDHMINDKIRARTNPVYACLDEVSKTWQLRHTEFFMQMLFAKASEFFSTPVKYYIKEEENPPKMHAKSQASRLFSAFKLVMKNTMTADIPESTFLQIIRFVCHPQVSPDAHALRENFDYLTKNLKQFQSGNDIDAGVESCGFYFERSSEKIVQECLLKRSGILSPNALVRTTAKNILICMGWSGHLALFISQMMPVFNYRAIEMLDKMEALFKTGTLERVPHYELTFFAEMTKDLLKVFHPKDKAIFDMVSGKAFLVKTVEVAAAVQVKKEEPVEEKPAAAAAPEKKLSPADAMAAMMAKAKKAAKGKKKGGKPAAASAKPAAKPAAAVKKEEAVVEQVLTREEKMVVDMEQLYTYLKQLREIKAEQITTCLDIIRQSNRCRLGASVLDYQDLTFAKILLPLVKLLNLPAASFACHHFIQNLLRDNKGGLLFPIKATVLSCFTAIAKNELDQKTTQDFFASLTYIDQNANFNEMGEGTIQLVLLLANSVLKDQSVNLSIKEIALTVARNILESGNEGVKMFDIVRLTIGMLKTNYIAGNLSNFLKKLFRHAQKEELALLLQRLFEYQPVPRRQVLIELLNYDMPLFCPVWFSAQMWVLQFDEELGPMARKIWNKFGLVLRTGVIDYTREKEDCNLFYYLRSDNFNTFELTSKATSSALELFGPTKLSTSIDALVQFYRSEWVKIDEMVIESSDDNDNTKDFKVRKVLMADQRLNRSCVAQILCKSAQFITPSMFEKVLRHLITESSQDSNEAVRKSAHEAAITIIKIKGPEYASDLLSILESFMLEGEQADVSTQIKEANQSAGNTACVLIATLATYLGDTSVKKLTSSFESLLQLLQDPKTNGYVQKSICKAIPQLAKYLPEKAREGYLIKYLTILRETKDSTAIKGAAFAVAGLLKCGGMQLIEEMDIFGIFGKESFHKKAEPIRKQAGCTLYECMAIAMGRSFEVYIDTVFPAILLCIPDHKEQVRLPAQAALKIIMGNFSNHAIKKALPNFLKELENENWRSKLVTVEALGNMAYCAPKQIASFLPQIVKGLRDVLNDTHEKVHDAAIQAIHNIGSVIKCPEVGEMLETLIMALANTNTHLNEALTLLISTSFVHSIDAPSLSLLVPILDSGLSRHDSKSKEMAAQLMGNICTLTSDASDLLPYMEILRPAIKNSLFDSIPEIRASAAKALGSLARGLGIANSEELFVWLSEHLMSESLNSAERQGAAQGFAEMISVHGVAFFEENIDKVIVKCKNKNPKIRESYRGIMVFLPASFDKFVEYLPKLVPIMIEGLADDVDEVRKVSMRNVKICIKQFGQKAPMQIVAPVLSEMFSEDFRVRHSASSLMYQLVKELENDVIKAQPKYVSMDVKYQILSSMFILKYDTVERVHTQASQIWKNIVDNQLFILKQVIKTLITQVFKIIISQDFELQEMGLGCMRGLVEKFGEKLVNEALDIFENLLDSATDLSQTVGVCRVLCNMAQAASHRLLIQISPRLLGIMDNNLASDSAEIRDYSTEVFVILFRRQQEKEFLDANLGKSVMNKLNMFVKNNKEAEADLLIVSLKQMLNKAPELRIQDRLIALCDVVNRTTPFTLAQARVLQALASEIAPKVFTKRSYFAVLSALFAELEAPVLTGNTTEVVLAYAEVLSCVPYSERDSTWEELDKFYDLCESKDRAGLFIDVMAHYCKHPATKIDDIADLYCGRVLAYMNDSNPEIVAKVVICMNSIFGKLTKEAQFLLVPQIRCAIEKISLKSVTRKQDRDDHPLIHLYQKLVKTLAMFRSPGGVSTLVGVLKEAIMHGSVQVRTDSAFCFKYVLDFSPPDVLKKEIIKICGALIRVVNDKFPQELKLQIFLALRLIQLKGAASVKATQAQLQTTFLKALGDPQSSLAVRKVVIECLLLLVQTTTRVDPIVKELTQLLNSDKIDGEQKMEVSQMLALLIRNKGAKIQQAMSETCYNVCTDILSNIAKGGVNDKIIANVSIALAYLSAHSADPKQMEALYSAFDESAETSDPCLISIKWGILTNGNDKLDKTALRASFAAMLTEKIEDQAGFEEVDDCPMPCVADEEGLWRFKGVLSILSHLTDTFGRRSWCQEPDSEGINLAFDCVNKSECLTKLKAEEDIGADSFANLLHFLANVPVKTLKSGLLAEPLAKVLTSGLACVQQHYLDFPQLYDRVTDVFTNVCLLNYDNFIDSVEEDFLPGKADLPGKINKLDMPRLKEAFTVQHLNGVISEDLQLFAMDISFPTTKF